MEKKKKQGTICAARTRFWINCRTARRLLISCRAFKFSFMGTLIFMNLRIGSVQLFPANREGIS